MKNKRFLYVYLTLLVLTIITPSTWAAYVDNGNGTVTDNVTGLTWQQGDEWETYTFQDALDHCEKLSLANYDDWRLPNIRELESLVDDTFYDPALDPAFTDAHSNDYWSSTADTNSPFYSWSVEFSSGHVNRGGIVIQKNSDSPKGEKVSFFKGFSP